MAVKKVAKPSSYTESEKIQMNNFIKTAAFNLDGMNPRLVDGRLVLEVPAFETRGPMLTEEFVNSLHNAGLNDTEIEAELDEFFLAIDKRLMIKVFAERLMK